VPFPFWPFRRKGVFQTFFWMDLVRLTSEGCFCISLLIEVPPLYIRSFGIKYLAMVFARSLRNKDLAVKYFSVNDLGAMLADLACRCPKHPRCRRDRFVK